MATPIDSFADALYDLLHERAQSIGLLDISIEVNDAHVDGELMFSNGPDMGFTLDTVAGTCRFCELLGDDRETWLDETVDGIVLDEARSDELRREAALLVLQGVLDARRPLLKRD